MLHSIYKRIRRNNVLTKRHSIEEKIKELITKRFNINEKLVTLKSSYINDLGADSIDISSLIMEFEVAFDMNIPDEDMEKMLTVDDSVNYIYEFLSGNT